MDLAVLVDPLLGSKGGNQGLRAISLLQAAGFDTFSYFSQWRTRDLRGYVVPREPGGYTYVSLADHSKSKEFGAETALACLTTQASETDHFSLASIVRGHLEGRKPGRLCLVVDLEDFSLQTAGGRPIKDEEYVRGYRLFYHSELLGEAVSTVRSQLRISCDYCPSWSTLGWAVGIYLVDRVSVGSLAELVTLALGAPYLALWEDMTHLTSYGDKRPESLRFPVDRPEVCLARHYGLPYELARQLWQDIDRGADELLNPYTREKRVRNDYGSRLSAVSNRPGQARAIIDLAKSSVILPGGRITEM